MDIGSVLFGTAFIVFAAATFFLRNSRPHIFKKLGPMKERFGERGGMIIHTIAYTVIPFVVGMIAVYCGLNGISFL